MGRKYEDDQFDHLESDIEKVRYKHRMYLSASNAEGAHSVVSEIINNALDECRTPKSPGNKIHIEFDERDGFIVVEDNGRGIPTEILEKVFISLNMGSNINTANKAKLHAEVLGQNGVGSLATCALAERVIIRSNRGGTENKYKELIFEEGTKVDEHDGKCSEDKHGMYIKFKPSKVLGKETRIIWKDIHQDLLNLQYLNRKKINIDSIYYDKDGNETREKYKISPFQDILTRNDSSQLISPIYGLTIASDDLAEDVDGKPVKRFMSMDIAFAYTTSLNPYIDSFSNSNNTIDNGDHLDGAIEALCRFFQSAAKNSMSDREKDKLDIKWEDVKTGLSIAVALRCNFENIYTSQTKHKVLNADVKRSIIELLTKELNEVFGKNQSKLKTILEIVKTNARARREGDKVRAAVVKNSLTNWSSYKMKNFDPCTNKGKTYKELFIVEGESAKGSLKQARDPKFQALYAIRGVSANAFRLTLDQIVGKNGNKEFTDLTTILGCNVGSKFDMSKLNYNKIIIATDADVDALLIRGLLLAFFFKIYPEIVQAGMIYIAEPPLYRINDKKDPFVINTADYLNRYVQLASKEYKVGYKKKKNSTDVEWLDKKTLVEFLDDTKSYVKDIMSLVQYRHVNDRLLELVLEELVLIGVNKDNYKTAINDINIQHLMDRIGEEFVELYYDDHDKIIRGSCNSKWQELEIDEALVRKSLDLIEAMDKWMAPIDGAIILRNIKNGDEHQLSLLGVLKILQKYQPDILHRFKGLINRPYYLN